jgi:hypothetical protein
MQSVPISERLVRIKPPAGRGGSFGRFDFGGNTLGNRQFVNHPIDALNDMKRRCAIDIDEIPTTGMTFVLSKHALPEEPLYVRIGVHSDGDSSEI